MEEHVGPLRQPALNNTFQKKEARTNIIFLMFEDKSVRDDSNGFANNETIQ